MQVAPIL